MPLGIPVDRRDFTNPVVWTAYVKDTPYPADMIGRSILPRRDVPADTILEEIGKFARPMVPFASLDEEAHELDYGASLRNNIFEAFNFKAKVRFTGHQLRFLREYGDKPVPHAAGAYAAMQARKFREAVQALNDGLDTRLEWLALQAVQGAVVEAPNPDSELDIDVTYPVTTVMADPA